MNPQDEHDRWMIKSFPALYRRGGPEWQVNRYGTLMTPVWDTATANESRLLDQMDRADA